ncbi:MAG: hypothetical protein A2Y89_05245 [Chloroflexi bacterium RBG_13_51_18]|nr:MAG: hypothetical protein A2Y89_05245 [Chloroflexi bacterium RBG_13_51_18]
MCRKLAIFDATFTSASVLLAGVVVGGSVVMGVVIVGGVVVTGVVVVGGVVVVVICVAVVVAPEPQAVSKAKIVAEISIKKIAFLIIFSLPFPPILSTSSAFLIVYLIDLRGNQHPLPSSLTTTVLTPPFPNVIIS